MPQQDKSLGPPEYYTYHYGTQINELEDDESMQRDTAFMNDKRHLK